MDLNILLAETNREEAESLEEAIGIKLESKIEGVRIFVKIVTTLAEALRFSPESDATIIYLNLEDAGPDKVVDALPRLRSPVIVVTDDMDPILHARCIANKARLLVPHLARNQKIFDLLLECFALSVLERSPLNSPE